MKNRSRKGVIKVKAVDRISIINSYILVFCILFVVQKYTIGMIPGFRQLTLFGLVYLHEVIFAIVAVFVISRFVKIGAPTRR